MIYVLRPPRNGILFQEERAGVSVLCAWSVNFSWWSPPQDSRLDIVIIFISIYNMFIDFNYFHVQMSVEALDIDENRCNLYRNLWEMPGTMQDTRVLLARPCLCILLLLFCSALKKMMEFSFLRSKLALNFEADVLVNAFERAALERVADFARLKATAFQELFKIF